MTVDAARAMSFGAIASDYDRLRPSPSPDAIRWLLPARCDVAVDLAAGTGLLTRALVGWAGQVIAVEPDGRMTAVLRERSPGVHITAGRGEAIPLRNQFADAVLVSSAWHWMIPELAVPEIARVLRDGGRFGVLWTSRDREVGWVRNLDRLREPHQPDGGTGQRNLPPRRRSVVLPGTDLFTNVQTTSFQFSRRMAVSDVIDMLATYSAIITASEADRAAAKARLRAELAARFGGATEIDVPMRSLCWRADRACRLCGSRRQPELEPGSLASRGGAGECAGVGGGDAAGDGQAEPVAVDAHGVRAVQPREALEDAFSVCFGDAGPGVGDFDLDRTQVAGNADGDMAAVGGGVPCVAEQVVQDLPDALRVAVQVDVVGRMQADVHRRPEFPGELDRGSGHRHEVEVPVVQRGALFQAGDGEQIVDEPPGPVSVAQDLDDKVLAGGAAGIGAQQRFCAGLNARHWRPQFVRCVGEEAAHALVGMAKGPGFHDRQPAEDDEQAQARDAGAKKDLPGYRRLGQQGGGEGEPERCEDGHHESGGGGAGTRTEAHRVRV
jgi:SAM-dependent methyltransferase